MSSQHYTLLGYRRFPAKTVVDNEERCPECKGHGVYQRKDRWGKWMFWECKCTRGK